MRIQEAIQARNASIKQAAMWEGESVGWAGMYVLEYSLLRCYF